MEQNSKVRTFNNPEKMYNKNSEAEAVTMQTFQNYLHRFSILAQSRFKWDNLPENVTSRMIEKMLFKHGQFVFYHHTKSYENLEDENIYADRYYTLPFTYESLDMYGDPINLHAYGLNGYGYDVVSNVTGVIVRNNPIATNTYDTCLMFAQRLTNALRTQDLNIHLQKKPLIYICEESQKRTIREIMKKADSFEPYIMGVKNSLDLDTAIKVVNEPVQYIADKLTDYKNDLWNEILTFFGISMNSNKKERLVESEVASINHFATASINTMLESRREAMYAINNMYGLNIDVHVNDIQDDFYKMFEVEKNGENL